MPSIAMMSNPQGMKLYAFLIIFSFLSQLARSSMGLDIRIQNDCPRTIFPQLLYTSSTGTDILSTSYEVQPREFMTVTVPDDSPAIWIVLRTECKSNGSSSSSEGGFHQCRTGDCGISCLNLTQVSDATVIQMKRSGSSGSYIPHVSYEHGCNVPNVEIIPFCLGCSSITCSVDLNNCPDGLKEKDGSGSVIACRKPENLNQAWMELAADDESGSCRLPSRSGPAAATSCTDCSAFRVNLSCS